MENKIMPTSEEKLLELIHYYSEKMEEIMQDEEDVDLCEEIFLKYIGAYEKLLSIDFDKYAEEVANEYYMFADFYTQYKPDIEQAIEASTKKLNIYKKLADKDKSFLDEVGYSYIELGEIYENDGNDEMAEKMYKQAKNINPNKF